MKLIKTATLLLSLLVLSAPVSLTQARAENSADPIAPPKATIILTRCDFRSIMRKLVSDHASWTRLFIISDVGNLADKESTVQRLLKNQEDIGTVFGIYYGSEAGSKITKLLTEHIMLAAKVVDAAKARNDRLLKQASAEWFANADALAITVASLNPANWSITEMKSMMREHLQLTTKETETYIQGNYAASVIAFDKVHFQVLSMADMLSKGIIQQFPRLFR